MKNINYSINRRSFNAAMILPIIQRRALLRTVLITTLLIPFSIVSANQYQKDDKGIYNLALVENYPSYTKLAKEESRRPNFDLSISPFSAIHTLLMAAKHNIWIEQFYIQYPNLKSRNDNRFDKSVLQPLIKKAKSGVNVYIVVNWTLGYTNKSNRKALERLANASPNIHIKVSDYFSRNPAYGAYTFNPSNNAYFYPKFVFVHKLEADGHWAKDEKGNWIFKKIAFQDTTSLNNAYLRSKSGKYYKAWKLGGIIHAKVIVVDGKSFYLGSHNLSTTAFVDNHELGLLHISSNTKDSENLDLQARRIQITIMQDYANADHGSFLPNKQKSIFLLPVSGKKLVEIENKPINKELNNNYIAISPGSGTNNPATSVHLDKSLNFSHSQEEEALVNLISSANSSIKMTAMNFSFYDDFNDNREWKILLNALIKKAKQGIKIELMASARNWSYYKKVRLDNVGWGKFLAYKNVTLKYTNFRKPYIDKTGKCIPFSLVDHAKYAIIDSDTNSPKFWLSTGNLQSSYFETTRDYGFIGWNDPKVALLLNKTFDKTWSSKYAHAITNEKSFAMIHDQTKRYPAGC